MSRQYTNFLSLSLLSIAFFVAFKDYYASTKPTMLAQYTLPDSVRELENNDFQPSQENKFDSEITDTEKSPVTPQLILAPSTDLQARTLQVSKGDTWNSLLREAGLSKDAADAIIGVITKTQKKSERKLKPGQTIVLNFKKTEDNSNTIHLIDLEFSVNNQESIIVQKNSQGEYIASVQKNTLHPTICRSAGRIHSSFYSTALQSGVPKKIVSEAISLLTYIMNFQHGIKRGDSFEILYEEIKDRHGKTKKIGNIRYIGFMAGNKYHRIYRLEQNGVARFFDEKGQSITRGLLQTPIDPRMMRITSGFCKNRLHPIHGFTRAHKGVDFAARTNTEIRAAGDGVIVKLGYYGEYGNYIKIRHSNGYETAYGHLSRYGKNLRAGSKVSQNQVIGFVGSTGSATGPHLHFEVIHKGVHVNPMGVKSMPAMKLVGKDLKTFNRVKNDLEVHLVGLTPHTNDDNKKASSVG